MNDTIGQNAVMTDRGGLLLAPDSGFQGSGLPASGWIGRSVEGRPGTQRRAGYLRDHGPAGTSTSTATSTGTSTGTTTAPIAGPITAPVPATRLRVPGLPTRSLRTPPV